MTNKEILIAWAFRHSNIMDIIIPDNNPETFTILFDDKTISSVPATFKDIRKLLGY